jgi:hypothetical protein
MDRCDCRLDPLRGRCDIFAPELMDGTTKSDGTHPWLTAKGAHSAHRYQRKQNSHGIEYTDDGKTL